MTAAEEAPWIVRPYDRATDEDGLMYLLGVGYTRTRAGMRARANGAGSRARDGGANDPHAVDRQKAFLDAHRPVWAWLLERADVVVAVDRESPARSIWAWLVTSGPDVVHAVGAKRALCGGTDPLSVELVRDLLGDRLARHQVCTLELPQMRTRGNDAIGLDRPREWSLDPTWLLTRMAR